MTDSVSARERAERLRGDVARARGTQAEGAPSKYPDAKAVARILDIEWVVKENERLTDKALALVEENERLQRVVAAARRLKEAEHIDAKMGYPLPGDSALAVYLCTLDEALDALVVERDE